MNEDRFLSSSNLTKLRNYLGMAILGYMIQTITEKYFASLSIKEILCSVIERITGIHPYSYLWFPRAIFKILILSLSKNFKIKLGRE